MSTPSYMQPLENHVDLPKQEYTPGQVWANHEHGDAKLYNTESEVNGYGLNTHHDEAAPADKEATAFAPSVGNTQNKTAALGQIHATSVQEVDESGMVTIPAGLKQGDIFDCKSVAGGKVFTLTVPEGKLGGNTMHKDE